jgi:hypothetical protein
MGKFKTTDQTALKNALQGTSRIRRGSTIGCKVTVCRRKLPPAPPNYPAPTQIFQQCPLVTSSWNPPTAVNGQFQGIVYRAGFTNIDFGNVFIMAPLAGFPCQFLSYHAGRLQNNTTHAIWEAECFIYLDNAADWEADFSIPAIITFFDNASPPASYNLSSPITVPNLVTASPSSPVTVTGLKISV